MQLFVPIVEESKLHPNFRAIARPENAFALDVLNDWASGFIDRDNKFVREFQTSFNSSFWELYLFAVLKKFGFRPDFSKDRPDFCLPSFDIEATVAEHARGSLPEHRRLATDIPVDLNEFNRTSIIRVSNALEAKVRKYRESYSKLPHVAGRPFIIAIASFDQPNSFLAASRAIDAVLHAYYVDEERYISAGDQNAKLEGEELLKVIKDNGSPVELGLFTTPAYGEVSAVIFSSVANWGKVRALAQDPVTSTVFTALRRNSASPFPNISKATKAEYQESLLDGLRVYYNPFATHPLDPATFRHPAVFQSYYADNDWVYEAHDGQLQMRFVHTLVERLP